MAPRARRWRAASLAAAAAAASVLAAGCSSGVPGASEPTAPPASVGPVQTMRIGYIGRLADDAGSPALAVARGERLAVSQFGGDRSGIDLLVDAQSSDGTEAGAAAAARRLVADHVVAVIGPQTTAEVRGAAPVLGAAGIPTLTVAAASTGGVTSPSLFRIAADDTQQGTASADELTRTLALTTLAVVSSPAVDDRARARAATAEARRTGATVAVAATLSGTARVAPLARRIVGSGAAGVYYSGPPAAAAVVLSALDGAGYQGVLLVAAGNRPPQAVQRSLGAGADGVYVVSAADDPAVAAADGGPALVFDDAYRAAFGQMPPIWSAEAYDATRFVLAGLVAGATTPAAVDAYLVGHSWPGVTAQITFAADGDEVAPPVFVSRDDGGSLQQIGLAGAPAS